MGKVSKPLTIVVFPPLDTWPEFEKMEKQGHRIITDLIGCDDKGGNPVLLDVAWKVIKEADIIMGPKCWYLTELHRKHLLSAVKQARLRKYGTITKKRKKGDDDGNTESDTCSSDPESPGC